MFEKEIEQLLKQKKLYEHYMLLEVGKILEVKEKLILLEVREERFLKYLQTGR